MSEELTIGHYKVQSLIGSGAMGVVHVGIDPYIERPVAIKSLKSDFVTDPEFVSRFRAEAKSLALLSHQNIATLYTPIFEAGQLHLVMELVKGKSLEAMLVERGGPLGVKATLAIAAQACDGLAYAHEMGVIHRDIKPSNLMIGQDGRVKIMDFGIARVQGSVRLTRVGAAVGTPLYMSPEQCRGEVGDERSDVYSLAVVIYEMLMGTPPFAGVNEMELAQAHLKTPPPPLVPKAPGVTPALEATIMIALAKRPDQRFASMKAFSDALGATAIRPNATAILRSAEALEVGAKASTLDVAQSRTRSLLRGLRTGGLSLTTGLVLVILGLVGWNGYTWWKAQQPAAVAVAPAPVMAPALAPAPPPPPATTRSMPPVEPTPTQVAAAPPPPPPPSPVETTPPSPVEAPPAPKPTVDALAELRTAVRGSAGSRVRAKDFEYLTNPAKVDLLPRAQALAAKGVAEAQFIYGMLLLSTADHIDLQGAFQAMSEAAKQDYPDAQTTLGIMYNNRKFEAAAGHDPERARFWFAKGAENGDPKARYWLGCYNQFGVGGATPDAERAALDFKAAADGGYELANVALQALTSGNAAGSPCKR